MNRPPLSEIAIALEKLSQEEIYKLVVNRLIGQQPQGSLPYLERDEDPSDILIDSYFWLKDRGRVLTTLKLAATVFLTEVLNWDNDKIRDQSGAVFEIIWLCACLKIQETIHIIGCLGMRDQTLNLIMSNGERLSNLALRSIIGITAPSGFFYKAPQ